MPLEKPNDASRRALQIGTPVACGVGGSVAFWLAAYFVKTGLLGTAWGTVIARCASVAAYSGFVTALVIVFIRLPMAWVGVQSTRASMLIKALCWVLILGFAVTSRWLVGPVLPQWMLLFLMAAGLFGAIVTGAAAIMAPR